MYAKIISLGVVTTLLAISAGNAWLQRTPADADKAQASWLYSSGMGQFQEYAQYTHDDLLVTMAYDHNRLIAHNAVNCFLGRGEQIESSTVRSLKTLDGSARFNVAHFANGSTLDLVAVSQCLAQSCVENPPPPGWADLWRFSFWKASLFTPIYNAVPISISIGRNTQQQEQTPFLAMEQALVDFVANLDLSPVRRQAQIEGGAGK